MIVALHSEIRAGAVDGYRAAHLTIPEELVASFDRFGIHDWTIWRSGHRLFHLVDCDDFDAALAALDDDPRTSAGNSTSGATSSCSAARTARRASARSSRSGRSAPEKAAPRNGPRPGPQNRTRLMGVIDAHVHVWDPRRFDYPWLSGLPALNAPMLPDDVDRAGGRVSGMVFVQADCAAESSLDEARWVAGAEWPDSGIVAAANLHDEAALPGHLDALAEIPGVVGIRHLLQGEPDSAFSALRCGTASACSPLAG